MADERATPEKRLLRLIETPKKHAFQEVKKGFELSLSTIGEKIDLIRGKDFSDFIKGINKILTLLIIGLGLYLIAGWPTLPMNLVKITNPVLRIGVKKKGVTECLSLLKEASYYCEKANSRDIFELGFKKVTILKKEEKKEPPPPKIITPREELEGIIKDWQLVGVAWSNQPEAMIEDKKSGKTFVCRQGALLEKSVAVIDVLKEKVVLEYKGEKAELKL